MNDTVMTPREVDRLLGFPRGRTLKLAKRGLIPHVVLPTVGKEPRQFRFVRSQIDAWISEGCPPVFSESEVTP